MAGFIGSLSSLIFVLAALGLGLHLAIGVVVAHSILSSVLWWFVPITLSCAGMILTGTPNPFEGI